MPGFIEYQTPLEKGSYTAVDNVNQIVDLVNANEAKLKPDGSKVGFHSCYVTLGGEVAGAAVYMSEPTALALDANGNPTQVPKDVILETVNIQYNTPETRNGS